MIDTYYNGKQYSATAADVLKLQKKLLDAQDRGATHDACAIGHCLAGLAIVAIHKEATT